MYLIFLNKCSNQSKCAESRNTWILTSIRVSSANSGATNGIVVSMLGGEAAYIREFGGDASW